VCELVVNRLAEDDNGEWLVVVSSETIKKRNEIAANLIQPWAYPGRKDLWLNIETFNFLRVGAAARGEAVLDNRAGKHVGEAGRA
jgi:hypothetical protein